MYLRFNAPFDDGDEYVDVKGATFTIGRAADCDLQLMHPTVSRHHCRLSVLGPLTTIKDLDSSNGTYLNGRLLLGEQLLQGEDRLMVGMVLLEALDQLPADNCEPAEAVGHEAAELVAACEPAVSGI